MFYKKSLESNIMKSRRVIRFGEKIKKSWIIFEIIKRRLFPIETKMQNSIKIKIEELVLALNK